MNNVKNYYSYRGPVTSFGTCIAIDWGAETMAVSEKRARSNLQYKYKKEHGMTCDAKVELPGTVTLIL